MLGKLCKYTHNNVPARSSHQDTLYMYRRNNERERAVGGQFGLYPSRPPKHRRYSGSGQNLAMPKSTTLARVFQVHVHIGRQAPIASLGESTPSR